MKNTKRGFTLVELMIVIAIIGILAAVGYPGYADYVKKAQRADAIHALLTESGRMEEYYLNKDTYKNYAVSSTTSVDGFYTITAVPTSGAEAFGYLLTATRVQDNDPDCSTFTYNQLGEKGGENAFCWD